MFSVWQQRRARRQRLGDYVDTAGGVAQGAVTSYAARSMLEAAGIAFPGAGTLISIVFGNLLADSGKNWQQIAGYFSSNILRPLINAAKTKDFGSAAPLFTQVIPGMEHAGYVYADYPQLATVLYSVVLGNALATKDFGSALRFASIVDMLEQEADDVRAYIDSIPAQQEIDTGSAGRNPRDG